VLGLGLGLGLRLGLGLGLGLGLDVGFGLGLEIVLADKKKRQETEVVRLLILETRHKAGRRAKERKTRRRNGRDSTARLQTKTDGNTNMNNNTYNRLERTPDYNRRIQIKRPTKIPSDVTMTLCIGRGSKVNEGEDKRFDVLWAASDDSWLLYSKLGPDAAVLPYCGPGISPVMRKTKYAKTQLG
jgi:hypothetical protein